MGKLRRAVSRFFKKKIVFDDLLRTEPVSRTFGFDRGVPVDRYYIERFLGENAKHISGKVLEIAESTYSKKFGTNVASYEVLHYDHSNRKATIVGDLTDVRTLPDNAVDCFICTQTLNFIYDIEKAVEGSYKLLNNGGVFLGTVAGISQISRYDMDRWGDFWRFTDLSARRIFQKVYGDDNVEVVTYGNLLSSVAFLQGLSLDDLPDISLLNKSDADYQMIIGIKAVKRLKK
ncbi:MAG: methyltransferase domain-containing protein [Bacteroidales bacterium]|nr:methyltransferase domain-containing protein [Bacteroidales bacterium]